NYKLCNALGIRFHSFLYNWWNDWCYARFSSCGLSVPRHLLCCCALPLRNCWWYRVWYILSTSLLVAKDVRSYRSEERRVGKEWGGRMLRQHFVIDTAKLKIKKIIKMDFRDDGLVVDVVFR